LPAIPCYGERSGRIRNKQAPHVERAKIQHRDKQLKDATMTTEVEVKVDLTDVFIQLSTTEQEEYVIECLDSLPDNVLVDVLNKYVEFIDEKAMIEELKRIGYTITEE